MRNNRTTTWVIVAAVVVAVGVLSAGCGGSSSSVLVDDAAGGGCGGGAGTAIDGGVYGIVYGMDGYEVVEGEGVWSLISGAEDPMYIAAIREGTIDNARRALEDETGVVFVETPGCENAALISTTVAGTEGVVGLIGGAQSTLVIVAARGDGLGAGVRRGLEDTIARWHYPG